MSIEDWLCTLFIWIQCLLFHFSLCCSSIIGHCIHKRTMFFYFISQLHVKLKSIYKTTTWIVVIKNHWLVQWVVIWIVNKQGIHVSVILLQYYAKYYKKYYNSTVHSLFIESSIGGYRFSPLQNYITVKFISSVWFLIKFIKKWFLHF